MSHITSNIKMSASGESRGDTQGEVASAHAKLPHSEGPDRFIESYFMNNIDLHLCHSENETHTQGIARPNLNPLTCGHML